MKSCFLNVDLDIKSGSQSRLNSLAAGMGKRVTVMYCGPSKGKQHLLAVEISGQHKGPDATIHALCSVVEKLSPAVRRIWDSGRKEFDVGYELRPAERALHFRLRTDTLQRVASLGAALAVTCYRGENSKV